MEKTELEELVKKTLDKLGIELDPVPDPPRPFQEPPDDYDPLVVAMQPEGTPVRSSQTASTLACNVTMAMPTTDDCVHLAFHLEGFPLTLSTWPVGDDVAMSVSLLVDSDRL